MNGIAAQTSSPAAERLRRLRARRRRKVMYVLPIELTTVHLGLLGNRQASSTRNRKQIRPRWRGQWNECSSRRSPHRR